MEETVFEIREGQKYIVGDVQNVLPSLENQADVIYLDDAWARPQRAEWFGVEYDTHDFAPDEGATNPGLTTTSIIDMCEDALVEGGWLIADADDWLLPRLITHLQEEWGDVADDYDGGGYRRIGGVTFVTKSGEPDRSTPGMYFSNGGYPVVFAHKGETDRRTSTSARQIARQASFDGDWGSVKPIGPYRAWIDGLIEDEKDEHIIVPCAGTAPAAIAAEQLYGEDIQYTCIDNERGALEAFKNRREHELNTEENGLSQFQYK